MVYSDTIYTFGGKSGRSPFNDLISFNLDTSTWTPVKMPSGVPEPRCAHVCVLHGNSMYVFGGYNGRRYFDDCFRFCFESTAATAMLSLAGDLEQMVNNEQFADIRFQVEDRIVHAHRTILFARSEYFRRMLTGGYRESADEMIVVHGIGHDVFVNVLYFLYTGKLPEEATPPSIVEMLGVANLYGIDALKHMCGETISRNLSVDNVASILELADRFNAAALRSACVGFMVNNFAAVVRSDGFRDLIREDSRDLVLQVLADISVSERMQGGYPPFAHHRAPQDAIMSGE